MSARPILKHALNTRAGFVEARIPEFTTPVTAPSMDPEVIWFPTKPSVASRHPSLRGQGSSRGTVLDLASHRALVYESQLERDQIAILQIHPDVLQIIDQPPPVVYMDQTGRMRQHTFDFLVTTTDQKRHAIAVKPEAKVEKSGIQDVLNRIRAQVGAKFADHYLLLTDRHITRDKASNARLILRCRRIRNEGDIAIVREITRDLLGAFSISDIVIRSQLGARGFTAVVGLIDEGWLAPLGNGRIDYPTSIRRVAGK